MMPNLKDILAINLRRHPLSIRNKTRLLRSLLARADSEDVASTEALIQLNITARAAPAP
jgi:hypothetical protein